MRKTVFLDTNNTNNTNTIHPFKHKFRNVDFSRFSPLKKSNISTRTKSLEKQQHPQLSAFDDHHPINLQQTMKISWKNINVILDLNTLEPNIQNTFQQSEASQKVNQQGSTLIHTVGNQLDQHQLQHKKQNDSFQKHQLVEILIDEQQSKYSLDYFEQEEVSKTTFPKILIDTCIHLSKEQQKKDLIVVGAQSNQSNQGFIIQKQGFSQIANVIYQQKEQQKTVINLNNQRQLIDQAITIILDEQTTPLQTYVQISEEQSQQQKESQQTQQLLQAQHSVSVPQIKNRKFRKEYISLKRQLKGLDCFREPQIQSQITLEGRRYSGRIKSKKLLQGKMGRQGGSLKPLKSFICVDCRAGRKSVTSISRCKNPWVKVCTKCLNQLNHRNTTCSPIIKINLE